jgi:DNA polymerase III delta subunit
MLYVLTGSDVMKAKARAAALSKGHEVVRFGEGGEPFARVLGYVGARGLFAPKIALLLDRPSEDVDGKTLLAEHAEDFVRAAMPVIVIEPVLDTATKKAVSKHADIEEFGLPREHEAPLPSVFALTDAFASGDRKTAWILYRKLIENGSAAEEIHGALAWQARAMVLASKTKSAAEAGLKPFVYVKAKRAASRLGEEETENLSRELVRILHSSRMGGGDLEDLLEAFLLKRVSK